MSTTADWTLKPTEHVSLRALAESDGLSTPVSLREIASERNVPFEPFSLHELLTPQFQSVPNGYETDWENWIEDYGGGTEKLKPTTKREFVGALVAAARSGTRIRAVGAGHSHSRAAQPDEQYLDLASHAPLFELLHDLETALAGLDGPEALFGGIGRVREVLAEIDDVTEGVPALATSDSLAENLEAFRTVLADVATLPEAVANYQRLADLREALLADLRELPDPPFGHEGLLDHGAWLKDDPPGVGPDEELVRVKSGTMLKRLMRVFLADRDLGLANMGSWDGQTLAGAINTGTHGTGVRLPALPDMVRSVELVTVTESDSGGPLVQLRRIEPDNGITDRDAFEAALPDHHTVLHQDDDLFHAAVLGYGCLGVAYSYTLAVEDRTYWIEERERVEAFPDLQRSLRGPTTTVDGTPVPAIADDARHVNFLVNVARLQGKQQTAAAGCLVRMRDRTPRPEEPAVHTFQWPPERRRTLVQDFLQGVTGGVDPRDDPNRGWPNLAKMIENRTFDKSRSPFMGGYDASAYYVALRRLREESGPNEPPAPPTMAISTDVAVPADEVADALDTVVDAIQAHDLYVSVPLGVRFVAPSAHFLAPEYGRPAAMIEITFPVKETDLSTAQIRDQYAKPALTEIQRSLIDDHGGRPHLGKHNHLDAGDMRRLFPEFDAWLEVYDALNPFGTFNNGFTDQLGISN